MEKPKNIKLVLEEPTSSKRTRPTTTVIGSTKVVTQPYGGQQLTNGWLDTLKIWELQELAGMGRDRKFSRRDKTRQGQILELYLRQDKTLRQDINNTFKTKQERKMHIETRQDFTVH